ncbi:MAG: GNAT family acetyltransferase [Deltaproteobacteria bacterium]|nr:GNAT family acetyltransferase [Deltaproteobacteria bacterium]
MKTEIRPFQPSDDASVVQLWRDCNLVVPWNDPRQDIRRKLGVQPALFLVGFLSAELVATVMAGYEGHRGWLNYLAVAPRFRRQGLGRKMVAEAEARLREMGCPKINIQIRTSNTEVIEFYRKIGFKPDDVVSMGKRLEIEKEAT